MLITRRNFIQRFTSGTVISLVGQSSRASAQKSPNIQNIIEACKKHKSKYNIAFVPSGGAIPFTSKTFSTGGTYFQYKGKVLTVLHVTVDGERIILGTEASDKKYFDNHQLNNCKLTFETNDRPVIIQSNGQIQGISLPIPKLERNSFGAILTASSVLPIKIISVAPHSILFEHLDSQFIVAGNSGSPIINLNGDLIGVISTVLEGTQCSPSAQYEQAICLYGSNGKLINITSFEGGIPFWKKLGLGVYAGESNLYTRSGL